jgi:hypothetical protein
MKKIPGFFLVFILIILFIKLIDLGQSTADANKNIKDCNNLTYKEALAFAGENFQSFNAKLEIDNWKKWQVINIKDLINFQKFNQFTNRKRVDGKLFIYEQKSIKCFLKIQIRPHGDQKDHREGDYLPSLQVKVLKGNIFGVTDFLLLRPQQRGYSNEIFATQLFRSIGLMAPRTMMVDIEFLSKNYKFLFQEKIRKEFLENSGKREGPLLEGDERFVFHLGDVPFVNHRISNFNIVKKSSNYDFLSEKSLSILNMYGANHSQKIHRGWLIDYFSMQNNFNTNSFENLDIFDSIMFSIDALAGLSLQDRRFYYDAIQSKFIPIFYDGIPNLFDKRNQFIEKNIKYKDLTHIKKTYIEFVMPSLFEGKVSRSAVHGAAKSIILINSINQDAFFSNLNKLGANISLDNSKKAFQAIVSRLEQMKSFDENKIFDLDAMHVLLFENYFTNKFKSEKIAFNSNSPENYEICSINYDKCNFVKKSTFKKDKLLGQRAKIEKNDLIYLNKLKNHELKKGWFHQKNTESELDQIQIDDNSFALVSQKGISLKVLNSEKKITITKNHWSGRLVFTGKILKDWNIFFVDETDASIVVPVGSSTFSDKNSLTGCINFYNIRLENISINNKNSRCEDAINFINASGSVNEIYVENALSDGVDFDFSNLEIKSLISKNAKNDCADFSWGHYKIDKFLVVNCGDKGVSVGENSTVEIKDLLSQNTEIGVASKDSAILKIKNAIIQNTKICVAAYRKKQEFFGGYLSIDNYSCSDYSQEKEIEKSSFISINQLHTNSQ